MRLFRVFTLLFFVIVSLFAASTVLAATVVLSGTARDDEGNPLVNAKVSVMDSSSKQLIGSVVTDQSGIYTLEVPQGTYDITIIPPEESNLPKTTKTDIEVSSSMIYDFTVVSPFSVSNFIKSTPLVPFVVGFLLIVALMGGFLLMKNRK